MKLLSAPRQPFVGLALMAATGIIVAEIVPLTPAALILAAIFLAICILVALCWPKLAATYLIVAAGFFLLHKFATTNTAGQQLADKLGERPRVVTAVGYVITELCAAGVSGTISATIIPVAAINARPTNG